MPHDTEYLENVSTAFLGALHEAQDMVDAGELGAPLADVVRHARELHEIMLEEIGPARGALGVRAGGLLLEMGDRLRSLERMIASA
jgi:hypothetical protein